MLAGADCSSTLKYRLVKKRLLWATSSHGSGSASTVKKIREESAKDFFVKIKKSRRRGQDFILCLRLYPHAHDAAHQHTGHYPKPTGYQSVFKTAAFVKCVGAHNRKRKEQSGHKSVECAVFKGAVGISVG